MKKPEIWKAVLARLLPAKSDFTSNDWRTYVNRYLIPEIHLETLRFYGDNTSPEAHHPGLDYASPAHRIRLQAYPRHNQLFGVFDKLRLSENEIYTLCKWEGTRLAKENFERQTRTDLRDTTWDDIQPYHHRKPTAHTLPAQPSHQIMVATRVGEWGSPVDAQDKAELEDEEMEDSEDDQDDRESGEESEDELQQSVGVELNERLMAATEARERGEDATLDADWEQWMKEAIERGVMPHPSHAQAVQAFETLDSQTQAQVLHGSSLVGDVSHAVATRGYGDSSNRSTYSSSAVNHHRPTMYWGREIPEIFSSNPRPHIAALQAQLPPPPQYYPSAQVVSAPAGGPPSSAPSTTVPS